MKCPKCGYLIKAQDHQFVPENECPSCGVIFGKIRQTAVNDSRGIEPSELQDKLSPVSAASLQKARDRVERRLRDQQKAQYRDSRHTQTLRLARRLSAEGVRERQKQWEKENNEKTESSTREEKPADTQPQQQASSTAAPEVKAVQPTLKQPSRTIAIAEQIEKSDPSIDTLREVEESADLAEVALPANAPIQLFQDSSMGIAENDQKPPTLKEMLEDFDPPDPDQSVAIEPVSRPKRKGRGGLTALLPVVAWMILGAGITGAILSWTTLASAQSGVSASLSLSGNTLPIGLLIGFAYLATGVLGFAFFWVSSLFNRQLKDIEQLLLLQSIPKPDPEEKPSVHPE